MKQPCQSESLGAAPDALYVLAAVAALVAKVGKLTRLVEDLLGAEEDSTEEITPENSDEAQ